MARNEKIVGLRFILTQRCNYRCVYCHKENLKYSKIKSEKTDEKNIEQIIKVANENGAKVVAVTGGEPFLSKNLLKLLKIAKKYKQRTIINTNGSIIGKNKKALAFIDEMHVHLPALNQTVYNKLTGNGNQLSVVLENLLFLKKKTKIKIFLNIPVVRDVNELELKEIYKFGEKHGLKCRFLEIFPISKEMLNYYIDINKIMGNYFPNFRKISTYEYGVSKYKDNSGKLIYTCRCMCFDEKCAECSKNHYMHLTPDMKIKPCSLSSKTINCRKDKIAENIGWALNYLDSIYFLPLKYKKLFDLAKTHNNVQ